MTTLTPPDFATASKLELCDWFAEFASSIPDEKWTESDLENLAGCKCVLGHLGVTNYALPTPGAVAFAKLICTAPKISETFNEEEEYAIDTNEALMAVSWKLNDGLLDYQQPTPRARILAALTDVKAKLLEAK